MTSIRQTFMWMAVMVGLLGGVAAQGPDPLIKARVDAFVRALTSGTADEFEAMAREAFTPELLARRSADDRRQLVERIRTDFGGLSVPRVERASDDRLLLTLHGATGLEGTLELGIEPAPPHRITGLSMRVEQGGGDIDSAPPPPIDPEMSPDDLARNLDAYLTPLVQSDTFAGVVLIAKSGTPVFERAYGLANRDAKVPATVSTRFNLGSINKIFTKTAIGHLIAAGKLALTDTIGKLLPDYPNAQARVANVNQLLEHQAGVADFFGPAFDAADKSRFQSNADYFSFVAPQPLLFEPGARRQYCNGCYIVLGAIIERLSGMPYEKYIGEHVFARAGMSGAGFFHSDRLPADVAVGYTRRGPGGESPLHSNLAMHGSAGSGAGGAYASARDLLAFDGALRGGRLVDAKTSAWVLGGGTVGIGGGAPGLNAALESNGTWTIVVLANLDPPAAERLGRAINRRLMR